jgi:oligopeptide/dipeptide ABC transporter ATP-binding protein
MTVANKTLSRTKGQDKPILSVQGLKTFFDTPAGIVNAVDDVSFDLASKEILAIVGESGSGKTVTAQSILKLVPAPPGRYAGGKILIDGFDLLSKSELELEKIRGQRISMIFQNPRAALNPSFTVSTQLVETIRRHDPSISRVSAKNRMLELLSSVDFPDPKRVAASYPHQMSGGMCQRVGIALSIACEPEILIADEPTTGLDVLVQATILLLLKREHTRRKLPIILITHDLGVVRALATRVIVMYAGKIQEEGSADAVLSNPQHPYTKALINAVPHSRHSGRRLSQIKGQPPDLLKLPAGCSFSDRCQVAAPMCSASKPDLHLSPSGSKVRCHLFSSDRTSPL